MVNDTWFRSWLSFTRENSRNFVCRGKQVRKIWYALVEPTAYVRSILYVRRLVHSRAKFLHTVPNVQMLQSDDSSEFHASLYLYQLFTPRWLIWRTKAHPLSSAKWRTAPSRRFFTQTCNQAVRLSSFVYVFDYVSLLFCRGNLR